MTQLLRAPDSAYQSSNFQKHTSQNPLQRYLLGRFHQAVAELLLGVDAARVLDAGCGEGFALRELLAARGEGQAVGLDASPDALRLASDLNPRDSFTAGDLLSLPFPAASFDLVLCMEVLEHLDDPARGLDELCRVSRRYLLLSVPNEPLFRGANFLRGKNVRAWGNDPGHVNHWSMPDFLGFVSGRCSPLAVRTSFPWTIMLCEKRPS